MGFIHISELTAIQITSGSDSGFIICNSEGPFNFVAGTSLESTSFADARVLPVVIPTNPKGFAKFSELSRAVKVVTLSPYKLNKRLVTAE